MARWTTRVLKEVFALVREGRYRLTLKAASELGQLDLDLEPHEISEVLLSLKPSDGVNRVRSEHDGSWLYIFRPTVEEVSVYLKFRINEECVVISFHEFH